MSTAVYGPSPIRAAYPAWAAHRAVSEAFVRTVTALSPRWHARLEMARLRLAAARLRAVHATL